MLYERYVKNSSELVAATGILEGLKDLDLSSMEMEEYVNYMGPIWELNKKYRRIEDELDDAQKCVMILSALYGGMSLSQAFSGKAIAGMVAMDTTLDVADTVISVLSGDKLDTVINIVAIALPIFEGPVKLGKLIDDGGANKLIKGLSKSDYNELIKKLEKQGIKNIEDLNIENGVLKIRTKDGIVEAKLFDEVIGTGNFKIFPGTVDAENWAQMRSLHGRVHYQLMRF